MYFLETSKSTSTQMRKINDFKINALKVERVPNDLWKFKFFWDDAKNAKNDANVLKMYFFGFSMFFCYFWIFLKIYQNMGQKLGSNTTFIIIIFKQ